jgi:DNA-binding Xre family transcriptional regulator
MTKLQEQTASIWARVVEHRERTGVSLHEFSRRCGIGARGLNSLSAGKSKALHTTKIEKVERYLDEKL